MFVLNVKKRARSCYIYIFTGDNKHLHRDKEASNAFIEIFVPVMVIWRLSHT